MRRAPADDDPPNRSPASIARLARPLVNLQVLLHRTVSLGRGVVVDRAAAPFHRFGEYSAQCVVQPVDIVAPKSAGVAEGVETRPPQRFVGVDVAHPGEEILVHQKCLETPAAASQQLPEPRRGEVVGERLGSGREHADRLSFHGQPGHRIETVQADPPELADVAKPQFPAVGEREDGVNVAILRRAGRDDEQLTGHLEVNRDDRGFGRAGAKPDEQLLAATTDALDLAPGHRGGERGGFVAPKGRRPVRIGACYSCAYHEPAQVAGDGLDFRQLGHVLEGSGDEAAARGSQRTSTV